MKRLLLGPQAYTSAVQMLRATILAVFLLLSTRLLGAAGYGLLAAAVAFAAILSVAVGLGSGSQLVRTTARGQDVFAGAWGVSLAKYVTTGLVLAGLYVALAPYVLGSGLAARAIVHVAVAELIAGPLTQCCAFAHLARGRARTAATIQLMPALARALAAVTLLGLGHPVDVVTFTLWVAVALAAAAAATLLVTTLFVPAPQLPYFGHLLKPDHGWLFAASSGANVASTELDKLAVHRLASITDTGHYAAATRISIALSLPYSAIIQSKSQHLFSLGTAFTDAHSHFLTRYGTLFVAYGITMAALLVGASSQISRLLGEDFSGVSSLLVLAAWWIPLNGLRQLMGAVLVTMDRVPTRIGCDLIATSVFVALAIAIIPALGIKGATISLLAAETVGLAASAVALRRIRRANDGKRKSSSTSQPTRREG